FAKEADAIEAGFHSRRAAAEAKPQQERLRSKLSGAMPPSIDWPLFAFALVLGYVCGSIPFGVLLTRLAGVDDPRPIGSGHISANNVPRTGHKALAAATLLGDALKGAVAVLLTAKLFGDSILPLVAGFGAF